MYILGHRITTILARLGHFLRFPRAFENVNYFAHLGMDSFQADAPNGGIGAKDSSKNDRTTKSNLY